MCFVPCFILLRSISRTLPDWLTSLCTALLQADAARREQRRKSSGHRQTLPTSLTHEDDDADTQEEEGEEEEARARVRYVCCEVIL